MSRLSWEEKDSFFTIWLEEQEHYIELMMNSGYESREEAMEFMKLWTLEGIIRALINH